MLCFTGSALASARAKSLLTSYQVSKRLSEMEARGLIQLTGRTVDSNAGRHEREWEVKLGLNAEHVDWAA